MTDDDIEHLDELRGRVRQLELEGIRDRARIAMLSVAVSSFNASAPSERELAALKRVRDGLSGIGMSTPDLREEIAALDAVLYGAQRKAATRAPSMPELSDSDREYLRDLRDAASTAAESAALHEQFDDAEAFRDQVTLLDRLLASDATPARRA